MTRVVTAGYDGVKSSKTDVPYVIGEDRFGISSLNPRNKRDYDDLSNSCRVTSPIPRRHHHVLRTVHLAVSCHASLDFNKTQHVLVCLGLSWSQLGQPEDST